MKTKYVKKNKSEFNKWIEIANLFAKSMCPMGIVVCQFNNLTSSQRNEIKNKFLVCDTVRRKKIPKGEAEQSWLTGVMVDAHIIAYNYNIDPLTAILCIKPICKSNERIFVK